MLVFDDYIWRCQIFLLFFCTQINNLNIKVVSKIVKLKMKKLLLVFFAVFSFSAIHAEVEWSISDDGETLTISGTDMPNYSDTSVDRYAPWRNSQIKKVIIENGVTNIGNYAFSSFYSVTSVKIPRTVKKNRRKSFCLLLEPNLHSNPTYCFSYWTRCVLSL